ncbi:UDP-glucuronosyltransferase 2A1-like isoform X2 [Xyrauchen texanus]|uniref:UDP-glucuronosyltransferase 2A1-like isoform X2 n=1 Tax=Xyrauchen texanus TaxID=154827 RepID=UPI002241A078|nr:UDP-glucuronosyltransferase 2A1-like isoform X2 [Xyrauchen texanus]
MRLIVCLLSLVSVLSSAECGNILIWPTEGSHWINLKIVLVTLMDRGHSVTVLMPNSSLYMDVKETDHFAYHSYNVSISEKTMYYFLKEFLHFTMYEMDQLNILQIHMKFYQLFSKDLDLCLLYCDGILRSPGLIDKLRHEKCDVILSDPIYPCSDIVAEQLNIPLVYMLRFSIAHTLERMCGQLPAPPSFVPGAMSKLTDKMSFTERIINMLFYISQDVLAINLWKKYDNYYTEYLVWPTDGSHWINLKIVLETLMDRGQGVTVLLPNVSLLMKAKESDRFSYLPFNASMSSKDLHAFFEELLQFSIYEMDELNPLQIFMKFYTFVSKHLDTCLIYCDGILKSPQLMDKLRQGKFDVLLSDPMCPCSDIVAEQLNIPLVYTLRFSIAHTLERMCGQLPAPPSFVPGAMSKLTDKMSFTERIFNMLFYLSQDALAITLWKKYDNYYTDYLGRPTSFCEMMGKADIWLIRSYWDFEFPRPFLPNFKFVGGLHCTPAKPLSKVLWRYSGEKPDTLGGNTRIYDWIPQNDLLGHPKTRAFITHGGTNGIFEAIYHGVPMVGIPLFGDQPDNLAHMKVKGAAVVMDGIKNMQTQDLVDGLNAVINDPSYKENAMRLSRIHHDRPMKPLDEAVFWIEFVMRNKGAKHLRVEAHNLTWYQYHCLDVFAFLITIVTVVLYISFKMCKFFIMRCCFRSKRKSKKE